MAKRLMVMAWCLTALGGTPSQGGYLARVGPGPLLFQEPARMPSVSPVLPPLPPPLPSPAVSASLPAAAPARAEATGPTDAPLLLPGGVDPLVPDTLAAMPPAPPFALPDAAARTGEPAYPGAEAPGVAGGAPAAPAMTPQMLVQYFQLPMTNRGTSGVAQASVVVPVFMPPPPPGGAGPGSSATYISH